MNTIVDKKQDDKELEQQYKQIQNDLYDRITLSDELEPAKLTRISGVDLAYWQDAGRDYAVCCIVTIDYRTKDVIEIKSQRGEIDVPYIPGYLSFRELPLIVKTFQLLEHEPDLVIFDGNGYLHYRNMGIATHASFYLNKPTIGVAKSYLKIEATDYDMPPDADGAYTDIVIHDRVYGRALRTHQGVKPIFVSCGNRITLDTATSIVLSLVEPVSRQPLPTRLADIETRKQRQLFTGK